MAKKKEEAIESSDVENREPRTYELGFHIDPDLPIEEVKKTYASIRTILAERGVIVAEVEPEKIALAYTISRQEVAGRRDFNTAYFSWIAYEVAPEAHEEIVVAMRANTHIIRFIDLMTTKEAARHALEAHELATKVPEPTTEEASDTVLDAAIAEATA